MEVFKQIQEFPDFQVSNLGRIMNPKTDRVLKQPIANTGYPIITFFLGDKKYTTQLVHRLVAKTFIPNPHNLEIVNHLDGDKQNNRVDNLEWTTRAGNNLHFWKLKKGKLSKFEGVSIYKNLTQGDTVACKWKAWIKEGGKYIHLGVFDTELDAHKARQLVLKYRCKK